MRQQPIVPHGNNNTPTPPSPNSPPLDILHPLLARLRAIMRTPKQPSLPLIQSSEEILTRTAHSQITRVIFLRTLPLPLTPRSVSSISSMIRTPSSPDLSRMQRNFRRSRHKRFS